MIEATSKDRISITADWPDETVIMSGRGWLVYHAIGSAVADVCRDDIEAADLDAAAEAIRKNARQIAAAAIKTKEIR